MCLSGFSQIEPLLSRGLESAATAKSGAQPTKSGQTPPPFGAGSANDLEVLMSPGLLAFGQNDQLVWGDAAREVIEHVVGADLLLAEIHPQCHELRS